MFDISWSEFLLIGVVALIVIGPKELPAVMRTMGQWARKIRVMAGDFQNQFHEAMREAEMADLKKQVNDIAQDIKNYDPLKSARTEVEAIGRDLNSNLSADSSKDIGKEAASGLKNPAAISPAEEHQFPQITAEPEQVAAEPQPAPETAADKASSDSAGRGE